MGGAGGGGGAKGGVEGTGGGRGGGIEGGVDGGIFPGGKGGGEQLLRPVHVRFTPLHAPPESRKAPNLDTVPATLFSHCTRIRVSVRVGVRGGAGWGSA